MSMIDEISFRELTPADLAVIVNFIQSPRDSLYFSPYSAYPLSADSLHAIAEIRHAPTIALLSGSPVAYSNFIEAGPTCRLGNLIVSHRHRRRGIASLLLHHMEGIARSLFQAREVQLACFDQNFPGNSLFKSTGYRHTGTRAITLPDGAKYNLILYSKKILQTG